jgi:hypothetical protein
VLVEIDLVLADRRHPSDRDSARVDRAEPGRLRLPACRDENVAAFHLLVLADLIEAGAGLVVDTATLQTLGVTSLLLTIAGYWIGRYGETTGRDRTHAPFVSVAVVTLLYSIGALILHYMLGEPASASRVLLDALPFELIFNLILTVPVYALCRRLFRPPPTGLEEVQLLG